MNHREYIQQEAAKNIAFHYDCMDCLQKESNNTLTFLYVVVAAAFSGSVNLFSSHGSKLLGLSLLVLCAYLAVLAMYLVFGCLMARDAEAPANEPKNLALKDTLTSEEIQDFELENLQARIDNTRLRNEKTAKNLNRIRVLICLSPLFFLLVTAFLVFAKFAWLALVGCQS
jgi:hypothetical protein